MFKNLKILYYLFYRPKIFLPKKSYSMFGEDIFIEKYFRNKKKGFYIDVGGYHPLQGNNTQLLYKKGSVSYTHLRAHETPEHSGCRIML